MEGADLIGECRTLAVGLTFSGPPPRDSVSMATECMRVPRGEGRPMPDVTSWQIEADAAEFLRGQPGARPHDAMGGGDRDRRRGPAGRPCARRSLRHRGGNQSRLGAGWSGGQVVGLELNQGMLTVARRIRGDLESRQGDAASLPFPHADFDRVLCQFGLMFMPDRAKALGEMRRVLATGGGLGLVV